MSADATPGHDELEEYEAWAAGHRRPGNWTSPSRLLAFGLLLIAFNFTIGRFDLLPNPLGWLLTGWALRQLSPRHRLLAVAAWTAWTGLALSYLTTLMVWADEADQVWPVALVTGLLPVLITLLVCSALISLAGGHHRSVTRQAQVLRVAAPVLTLGTLLLGGVIGSPLGLAVVDLTSGPAVTLLVLVVASLAVQVWFIVLLLARGRVLDHGEADPYTNRAAAPA